jgi:hypothetical protein
MLFGRQGDQIRRIFAQWVILFFGQFFKFTKAARILGYFFPRLRLCIHFEKTGWAVCTYISGDLFTNSSGQPVNVALPRQASILNQPAKHNKVSLFLDLSEELLFQILEYKIVHLRKSTIRSAPG